MSRAMEFKGNRLLLGGLEALRLAGEYGTPLYVYEEDVIRQRYRSLVESFPYPLLRLHYACKANSNVHLLRLLREAGANAEAVSEGEVLLALQAGFAPDQILYTCSNIDERELRFLVQNRILVNLDSLTQLRRYGLLNPGGAASLRLNLDIGAGHHKHVITGGAESKFGVHYAELPEAKRLARRAGLRLIGVHQHIGSNVLEAATLLDAAEALLRSAEQLPDLEFVDFGGGLGVPYGPKEHPLDIARLGLGLSNRFSQFCASYGRPLTMILEPGRYLVAEAGTLLVTVTDVKRTPSRTFVGVDSGFGHLARPMVYGAYHPILNASRVRGPEDVVTVAGNLCESGDIFARDRAITRCREGDVLAILNAGAYGFSMSSNYNARPRPAEVLVTGNEARLIRPREALPR